MPSCQGEAKKRDGGSSGGRIELDPNLTYPVILNVSLNPTLANTPSNLVKDWFVPLLSIIVVIIGGFTTYITTRSIEREKNLYDLKKSVFFNIMEIVITAKNLMETQTDLFERTKKADIEIAQLKLIQTQSQTNSEDYIKRLKNAGEEVESRRQEALRLKQEFRKYVDMLRLQQMNLAICANDETNHVFVRIIAKSNLITQEQFLEEVLKELIPALRNDLIGSKSKRWWQFWRRQ